jgi:hypothetical protein
MDAEQLRQYRAHCAKVPRNNAPKSVKGGGKLGTTGITTAAAPEIIHFCLLGRCFTAGQIRSRVPALQVYKDKRGNPSTNAIATALSYGVKGRGMQLHTPHNYPRRFLPCRENGLIAAGAVLSRLPAIAEAEGKDSPEALMEALEALPEAATLQPDGPPLASSEDDEAARQLEARQLNDSYAAVGQLSANFTFADTVPEFERTVILANEYRIGTGRDLLDEDPSSATFGEIATDQQAMRRRVKDRQAVHRRICSGNDLRAETGQRLWAEIIGDVDYNSDRLAADQERAWAAFRNRTGKERPDDAPGPEPRPVADKPQGEGPGAVPAKADAPVSQPASPPVVSPAPSAAPPRLEGGFDDEG